jgi:hypothetical protein
MKRKAGVILVLFLSQSIFGVSLSSYRSLATAGLFDDAYDIMVKYPYQLPEVEGGRLYTYLSNLQQGSAELREDSGYRNYQRFLFSLEEILSQGFFLGWIGSLFPSMFPQDKFGFLISRHLIPGEPNTSSGPIVRNSYPTAERKLIQTETMESRDDEKLGGVIITWGRRISPLLSLGAHLFYSGQGREVFDRTERKEVLVNRLTNEKLDETNRNRFQEDIAGTSVTQISFLGKYFLSETLAICPSLGLSFRRNGEKRTNSGSYTRERKIGAEREIVKEEAARDRADGTLDDNHLARLVSRPYNYIGFLLGTRVLHQLAKIIELEYGFSLSYLGAGLSHQEKDHYLFERIRTGTTPTRVTRMIDDITTFKGRAAINEVTVGGRAIIKPTERIAFGIGSSLSFRGAGERGDKKETLSEIDDNSSVPNQKTTITDEKITRITERRTVNTFRLPLGVEVKITPNLTFRMGTLYFCSTTQRIYSEEVTSDAPKVTRVEAGGEIRETKEDTSKVGDKIREETIPNITRRINYVYGLGYTLGKYLQIDLIGVFENFNIEILNLRAWLDWLRQLNLSVTIKF